MRNSSLAVGSPDIGEIHFLPALARRSFLKFAGGFIAVIAAGRTSRSLFGATSGGGDHGSGDSACSTSPTLWSNCWRGQKGWNGGFDEPLSKERVLAMVSPFIRKAFPNLPLLSTTL